jgi:hypothetical protein
MSDCPPVVPLPQPGPRRWPRFALMGLIFLCGGVVGAVVSRIATQKMFLSMLKHPEQVPDRILPRLNSSLQLTTEQSTLVDEIVRRHHQSMELIRARSHPETLAEFTAMSSEIAEVLTPEQRDRWNTLSRTVEERYLPAPPSPVLPQRD